MIHYAAEVTQRNPNADLATEQLTALPEQQLVVGPPPAEFELGDASGMGYASHEVPDPIEGTAPEAEADQAYFSLDPAGAGASGSDAAISRATGSNNADGDHRSDATARPLTAFGLNDELKLPRFVSKARSAPSAPPDRSTADDPEPVAQAADMAEPFIPSAPPEPEELQPVALVPPIPQPTADAPSTPGSAIVSSDQPAADPARMSDSESDPFSRLGTATFRDGALHIRFGRKVKTRKPRLLLAAQVDLMTLQRVQVVLKIDIDETGKVTGVDVVKSSGSNEIDQPTRVAVYEWWFEPKKNSLGQPIPDQVQFSIFWR
jgi:TonB family protein